MDRTIEDTNHHPSQSAPRPQLPADYGLQRILETVQKIQYNKKNVLCNVKNWIIG